MIRIKSGHDIEREVVSMKFEHFIQADKSIVIVISSEEYRSIRHLLKEYYTDEQIEYIDEFCNHISSTGQFILCNPHETAKILTPVLYDNAVTFVDRILFKDIEF